MPPKLSHVSKKPKAKLNTVKLETVYHSGSQSEHGPPLKKLKTLTLSVSDYAPASSRGGTSVTEDVKAKGKAKALSLKPTQCEGSRDDRLWVDVYEPASEVDLAVHNRKVQDVRCWLMDALNGGPSGNLKKYRRFLALTGPAGTGKSATIRVLAREISFEILEWKSGVDDRFGDFEGEAQMQKFEAFLKRVSACASILGDPRMPVAMGSSSHTPRSDSVDTTRRIILLEDIPNVLHAPTRFAFHSALESLIDSTVPVVIIVSDSGVRGEDAEHVGSGGWRGSEVVDVRTVLGPLLSGPYVTQIAFNPVAPTLLRRALQALLSKAAFVTQKMGSRLSPPSKNLLDAIIESSNGDIRSAVMALQFASNVDTSLGNSRREVRKPTAGRKPSGSNAMIAVTNREQTLHLFHLMGKVLYNKRKGDPPNPTASAKDIRRDEALDGFIKDCPKLPPSLAHHERRSSRVNVETLYADTPIDSSLFGLYMHQNYPQFCDDVEQCEGVAEWLSWVDWSDGEAWYRLNPYRFHLLALGTLHSLPSPVPRRSQKIFKPEWFEIARKEKGAWNGVEDVRDWLWMKNIGPQGSWSNDTIAIDFGGVLRARDTLGCQPLPPSSHRLFSKMVFMKERRLQGVQIVEGDHGGDMGEEAGGEQPTEQERKRAGLDEPDGGWLESDDIEEF